MIIPKQVPDFTRLANGAIILADRNDRQRGPGYVVVGTNWCGYCNQLKDNVAKADKIMETKYYEKGGFPVYWVDATNKPEVTQAFNVEGFPSMWMVNQKGVLVDRYMGSRLPDQLISAVNSL